MVGVQITKGPQDWQIIQQEEGFGVFEAEGRFFPPETPLGAAKAGEK